jgi:plastocyanin
VIVTARRAALIAAASVLLVVPAAAQAKTKNVDMGVPLKSQKAFNDLGTDVNDYFLHKVTIRAGDKVRFNPVGFHTLDIPPKGGGPLPFFGPNGQTVSGSVDAALQPFWFNGQPQFSLTPALLPPGGFGKKFTYKGNKRVESGAPLAPNPKPLTVKFPKKGKYTYYCDIHPGMKGQVVVKGKRARVPTAKQDRRAVKKQIKKALKRAKELATSKPSAANTFYTGGSAAGGVEFFGMLPGSLTVPVGTTVRFQMSPKSYESHTATFGPGNPETEPTSYLGQVAAGFQGATLDPRGLYPSDLPGTTVALTKTLHGNGFWNSGVMDRDSASPPPASNAVTFSTAGTYDFYCLIHPFMHGRVTVQ